MAGRFLSGRQSPRESFGRHTLVPLNPNSCLGKPNPDCARDEVFIGLDVSKDKVDAGETFEANNNSEGQKWLAGRLKGLSPALIVMEATGGLEIPLAGCLAEEGFKVAGVNPRQARDFAKALGRLAKTDKVDAQVLAHFAEALRPEARPPKDPLSQELKELLARRRQLVEMICAERNRLNTASGRVRQDIQVNIVWLKERLRSLDKLLGKMIKNSPIWQAKDDLLKSVPGVGKVVSRPYWPTCQSWEP